MMSSQLLSLGSAIWLPDSFVLLYILMSFRFICVNQFISVISGKVFFNGKGAFGCGDGAEPFIVSVMQIQNNVVVVTGGANGIGQALCRAFAAEGARGDIVADLEEQAGKRVAGRVESAEITVDVGK